MKATANVTAKEIIYTYNFEFTQAEDDIIVELLELYENFDHMQRYVAEDNDYGYDLKAVKNLWENFVRTFVDNTP